MTAAGDPFIVQAAQARAAVDAALTAAGAILEVYARDFSVDYKDDRSPLTDADRAAHACILEALRATDIPILSEESEAAPYARRREWTTLWIVDPLDGTKEFVKRNGDFTVNIALVQRGAPVLGVVAVPAHARCYLGLLGTGAWLAEGVQSPADVANAFDGFPRMGPPFVPLAPGRRDRTTLRVVASRSHGAAATDAFIERLAQAGRPVERIARGSALKLCLVAAGEADIYPRLAPTMEWDIAAAQAVVEAAGGRVIVYDEHAECAFRERGPAALFTADSLRYNREQLRNPPFVVLHPGVQEP